MAILSQPWWLYRILCASVLAISHATALASDGKWTFKHEEGRCAIRGECGKKSFFGGQLPCPDNELAQEPTEDTRTKLIAICGNKWKDGPICCDDHQASWITYSTSKAISSLNLCLGRVFA